MIKITANKARKLCNDWLKLCDDLGLDPNAWMHGCDDDYIYLSFDQAIKHGILKGAKNDCK